jgi:hypothetical protein
MDDCVVEALTYVLHAVVGFSVGPYKQIRSLDGLGLMISQDELLAD